MLSKGMLLKGMLSDEMLPGVWEVDLVEGNAAGGLE